MNDLPRSDSDPGDRGGGDDSGVCEEECTAELLGAAEIVEAFTALRDELKLQVRNGRDLHQTLDAGLQRIEQRVASQQMQANGSTTPAGEARQLAEAMAEMEESLQRAREALPQRSTVAGEQESLMDRFDTAVASASWVARVFSAGLLAELRGIVERFAGENSDSSASLDTACRGLELLHDRVKRLMQQCGIERIDVLHERFDSEAMHAIDVVDSPTVPSSHVVEQLRPAYRWHGKILRYADVRLAR